MEYIKSMRFFLGANSRHGFHSLYDGFADLGSGDFLWVIKGGPGCGKSSFMRKIGKAAEERGYAVEYILCSGDPGSLDGVRIPALRTAYVDGTAPHIIECAYPGAASLYLDLGSFYDAGQLEKRLDDIVDINRRYKALYASAYGSLSAAAALLPRNHGGIWSPEDFEKVSGKAQRFAARELKRLSKASASVSRFISASSCQGRIFLEDSLGALCERICVLDNELGMADYYMQTIAAQAAARGYDMIVCHDSLEPELIEALMLPEASLAFVAVDKGGDLSLPTYRHMRLDALASPEHLAQLRPTLRQKRRQFKRTYAEALDSLAHAKELHDQLESIYNPLVDFDGVYASAQDHISWLFD